MADSIQLEIQRPGSPAEQAVLSWAFVRDSVQLDAVSPGMPPFRTVEWDLFEALCAYRRFLERKGGYLLLCNGARKDAFPSAMSREMGKGFKLYISLMGRPGGTLVETLDPAPLETVSTVAEQAAFHDAWFDSIRAPARATGDSH
ncbi:MAG: hypothetical protein QOI38_288 [Sphingomonadales bacterium]|jgi:hypothetical protein|nr:hypothetical protein [Sphingomonadales bacterium]